MTKKSAFFVDRNESVGLLSVTTGQLEIARIPVVGQPDWIIPKALILSIDDYQERIWTYLWKNQDVSVFHLLPKEQQPTSLVIIESITDVHRIALQIAGEVSFHAVRIADLKDIEQEVYQDYLQAILALNDDQEDDQKLKKNTLYTEQDYVFQPVSLAGEVCIVPDLDKLSHFLVDLDS